MTLKKIFIVFAAASVYANAWIIAIIFIIFAKSVVRFEYLMNIFPKLLQSKLQYFELSGLPYTFYFRK